MSKPQFDEAHIMAIKVALEFFVTHGASYFPQDIAAAAESREMITQLEAEHDSAYVSTKVEDGLSVLRNRNLLERELARNQPIRPPSDSASSPTKELTRDEADND